MADQTSRYMKGTDTWKVQIYLLRQESVTSIWTLFSQTKELCGLWCSEETTTILAYCDRFLKFAAVTGQILHLRGCSLYHLPPSKAADTAHLCVPKNQALGVCRGFVPNIQVSGTHWREGLITVTITSNVEEEEDDDDDDEEEEGEGEGGGGGGGRTEEEEDLRGWRGSMQLRKHWWLYIDKPNLYGDYRLSFLLRLIS